LAAEDSSAAASGAGAAPALAVFDLDGTITRHDSLAPLLWGYLWRHPWRLLRVIAALPAVLLFFVTRDRGHLKGAMIHAVLGGLSRAEVTRQSTHFSDALLKDGLFAEALERIRFHRDAGHHLVLLSASTDFYVPLIGARLGFAEVRCTPVRWDGDTLDGRLAGPNYRGEQKAIIVRQLQANTRATEIYAYGNSTGDLPHLRLATSGWYINGSQAKLKPADVNIKLVRWRLRGGI
jgi:HAD superfamily hydrolase (TIGR01490 family)